MSTQDVDIIQSLDFLRQKLLENAKLHSRPKKESKNQQQSSQQSPLSSTSKAKIETAPKKKKVKPPKYVPPSQRQICSRKSYQSPRKTAANKTKKNHKIVKTIKIIYKDIEVQTDDCLLFDDSEIDDIIVGEDTFAKFECLQNMLNYQLKNKYFQRILKKMLRAKLVQRPSRETNDLDRESTSDENIDFDFDDKIPEEPEKSSDSSSPPLYNETYHKHNSQIDELIDGLFSSDEYENEVPQSSTFDQSMHNYNDELIDSGDVKLNKSEPITFEVPPQQPEPVQYMQPLPVISCYTPMQYYPQQQYPFFQQPVFYPQTEVAYDDAKQEQDREDSDNSFDDSKSDDHANIPHLEEEIRPVDVHPDDSQSDETDEEIRPVDVHPNETNSQDDFTDEEVRPVDVHPNDTNPQNNDRKVEELFVEIASNQRKDSNQEAMNDSKDIIDDDFVVENSGDSEPPLNRRGKSSDEIDDYVDDFVSDDDVIPKKNGIEEESLSFSFDDSEPIVQDIKFDNNQDQIREIDDFFEDISD